MSTAVARKATTVLLSSPERNRYKEFLKLLKSTTLYMPLWTDDEIEACRSVLHPHLSIDFVQSLQLKWGNIPRYVLEKVRINSVYTPHIITSPLDLVLHLTIVFSGQR